MHFRLEDDVRAKALIELVEGSVSQGIVNVINTYGYVPDGTDPQTFWLGDVADEVGLRFSEDWTAVLVLGDSLENVENANYVLNRGGWDSAKVTVASVDVEEQILGSFASVTVTDTVRTWETGAAATPKPAIASSLAPENASATMPPSAPVPVAPPAPAHMDPVFHEPPARPVIPPSTENEVLELQREIASLRAQAAERVAVAGGNHERLIPILEDLILSQLNQAFSSNNLVRQLNDAGYALTIRIVPRTI